MQNLKYYNYKKQKNTPHCRSQNIAQMYIILQFSFKIWIRFHCQIGYLPTWQVRKFFSLFLFCWERQLVLIVPSLIYTSFFRHIFCYCWLFLACCGLFLNSQNCFLFAPDKMFIKDIIRSVLLGKFLLNYSTFQYDNIVFMIFKKLKFKPSINKIRDELETIKRSLVTS